MLKFGKNSDCPILFSEKEEAKLTYTKYLSSLIPYLNLRYETVL